MYRRMTLIIELITALSNDFSALDTPYDFQLNHR